ncbi:MAG TPA: NAD(P)-binding protein, partial [Methanocorpusculum sp.]|nr:NAD(P)-binding protein [Methanocorpusculum sp.]
MKIGILGAGLTGLASALRLAEVGDVVVFEKNEMAGGCLASKKYGSYA